jgi:drug/metabolite transporter (DMT)-like permease
MEHHEGHPPSRVLLTAAFAAIYIIWGSTYLAMRVAVETLPPFLMAGVRFLIAGSVLFGWLVLRKVPRPTAEQWFNAAVSGTLLLVFGNGLVAWAEQSLSSSLTALLIAMTPVWFAVLDACRPHGVRPKAQTIVGILVGFAGVALLITGRGTASASTAAISIPGALAVIGAGICWAAGSLFGKYRGRTQSPWMHAAAQMLCGGVGLTMTSFLLGEPSRTNWGGFSTRSLWAFAYLVVAGSWVAFSAYVWLLKVATPAKVSTYAYVNPVIAVFLGWALLGESVTSRVLASAGVIVAGVVIITLPKAATPSVSKPVPRSARGDLLQAPETASNRKP